MSAGLLADFLQHCKEEFNMGEARKGFSELAKKYWENYEAIKTAEREFAEQVDSTLRDLPSILSALPEFWDFHKKSKLFVQFRKKKPLHWLDDELEFDIWIEFGTWHVATEKYTSNYILLQGKRSNDILSHIKNRFDEYQRICNKFRIEPIYDIDSLIVKEGHHLVFGYIKGDFEDLNEMPCVFKDAWDRLQHLVPFVDEVIAEYREKKE